MPTITGDWFLHSTRPKYPFVRFHRIVGSQSITRTRSHTISTLINRQNSAEKCSQWRPAKPALGPMRGNSELSYLTLRFATVTFYPLAPESVAAVYCGCRISRADKTAVELASRAPHLKHVELWLATLDECEYALKFNRC